MACKDNGSTHPEVLGTAPSRPTAALTCPTVQRLACALAPCARFQCERLRRASWLLAQPTFFGGTVATAGRRARMPQPHPRCGVAQWPRGNPPSLCDGGLLTRGGGGCFVRRSSLGSNGGRCWPSVRMPEEGLHRSRSFSRRSRLPCSLVSRSLGCSKGDSRVFQPAAASVFVRGQAGCSGVQHGCWCASRGLHHAGFWRHYWP